MNVQPRGDEPPESIDMELGEAVRELTGYGRYLISRISPSLSLLVNLGDCDDLTQDCYCEARKNWRDFRDTSNRRSWLVSVMHNTFVSKCEKALRRRGLFEKEFGGDT